MQKAFKWAFHSSELGEPVYLLCSLHMEKNLYDTLLKNNSKKITNEICHEVFGREGLVSSKSYTEYFDKFIHFCQKHKEHFEEKHLKTLYEKVWSGIVHPMILYPEILTQTTNRVESLHASTKSLIQHKPQKVDKMVDYSHQRITALVIICKMYGSPLEI